MDMWNGCDVRRHTEYYLLSYFATKDVGAEVRPKDICSEGDSCLSIISFRFSTARPYEYRLSSVRSPVPRSSKSEATLRAVYFSYIHSILSYGIIFWANCSDSNKIFKLQKRAIRIITRSKNKASCRELFKKLNILPLWTKPDGLFIVLSKGFDIFRIPFLNTLPIHSAL